MHSRFMALD